MTHSACATADPVPQHGLWRLLHVQCWTLGPPFLEVALFRKGNRKESVMKKKQPDLGRLGRMMNCYVLVNHKPKRASSLKEWMDFLASPDCIVASTDIGRVNVTTAFMGIDLCSTSFGPSMFFKTEIFGGLYDGVGDYAPTWGGAALAHEQRCEMLREAGSRKQAA
jgi:hypothetical protein